MRRFELPLFNEKICSRYVTQKHKNDPKSPCSPVSAKLLTLLQSKNFKNCSGFFDVERNLPR